MKLSDKLRQARTNLIERLEALNSAATDRVFTDDEQNAWTAASAEVAALDAQIKQAEQREELTRSSARPGDPPHARSRSSCRRGARLSSQRADVPARHR